MNAHSDISGSRKGLIGSCARHDSNVNPVPAKAVLAARRACYIRPQGWGHIGGTSGKEGAKRFEFVEGSRFSGFVELNRRSS
jgi:hypothetical protein